MDRRKFIKSSAGGFALGATGPVELGKIVIPNWKNISVEEMNFFNAQQDNTLDRIDNNENGGMYLKSLLGTSESKDTGKLFRDSMKTLLLSGNFIDLSTEAQMHPVVQKRIWDNSKMVDETISDLVSRIKSLSQKELSRIKEKLNTDPEIEEAIEETLVAEAVNAGAQKKKIRRFRKMIKRQLKRIKQSPGLVIDKYVHKYEKLMSRVYSEEEVRQYMIANMGEKAFNKKILEAEKASLRWQELDPGLFKESLNPNPDSARKKDPPKGLKLLGIGAITTGAGWLLITLAAEYGVLWWLGMISGVTVGPILIVIALIILIVNAIRNS